jgi:hypothetical protein
MGMPTTHSKENTNIHSERQREDIRHRTVHVHELIVHIPGNDGIGKFTNPLLEETGHGVQRCRVQIRIHVEFILAVCVRLLDLQLERGDLLGVTTHTEETLFVQVIGDHFGRLDQKARQHVVILAVRFVLTLLGGDAHRFQQRNAEETLLGLLRLLQLQEATLVLAKQTKPDGRGLPPTKLLAVCLCSPEQMRRYRDVEREGGREKRERERRERERKQNDVNTSPNERNTRTRLNSPTGRFSNRGVQLGGIDVEPTHRRLLVHFHFLGDLHAKQFAELVSAALL